MKKALTYTAIAGSMECMYNCGICISKMTPNQGIPNKGEPTINQRNYEQAKDIAQNYEVGTFLITSKGETLLYPYMVHVYLHGVEGMKLNKREIQTNGGLLADGHLDDWLRAWYDMGLNLVAVSIYHYDKQKNEEVFRPKHGQEYFDLERVIEKIHKLGLETRLSCVMLENYIDNLKEVENLIQFAKKNGVMQLTLRKADIPKNPINQKVANYVKGHAVTDEKYNQIAKTLAIKAGGKPTDVLPHGAKVFEIDKQNICFTTGLTPYEGEEEIRQLIFFPNGLLTTSWETPIGSAILQGWIE